MALVEGGGSIATEHTPPRVVYYLEEAARCRDHAAPSAAAAMYRAALEQFLFDQGYVDGMLNRKIQDLAAAIDDGTAPAWVKTIDPALLHHIKDLGNGAIHPNGGDISKQQTFDADLIAVLELVLAELLELAYELPLRQQDRAHRLQAAAARLKP